jgi:hypothetical protein
MQTELACADVTTFYFATNTIVRCGSRGSSGRGAVMPHERHPFEFISIERKMI